MLYNTELKLWSCISQYGFRPSPRWGAALGVSEQREQLFIFGGSNNNEGSCGNEVYCLDFSSVAVSGQLGEIRQCSDEANLRQKKHHKRNSSLN